MTLRKIILIGFAFTGYGWAALYVHVADRIRNRNARDAGVVDSGSIWFDNSVTSTGVGYAISAGATPKLVVCGSPECYVGTLEPWDAGFLLPAMECTPLTDGGTPRSPDGGVNWYSPAPVRYWCRRRVLPDGGLP